MIAIATMAHDDETLGEEQKAASSRAQTVASKMSAKILDHLETRNSSMPKRADRECRLESFSGEPVHQAAWPRHRVLQRSLQISSVIHVTV